MAVVHLFAKDRNFRGIITSLQKELEEVEKLKKKRNKTEEELIKIMSVVNHMHVSIVYLEAFLVEIEKSLGETFKEIRKDGKATGNGFSNNRIKDMETEIKRMIFKTKTMADLIGRESLEEVYWYNKIAGR